MQRITKRLGIGVLAVGIAAGAAARIERPPVALAQAVAQSDVSATSATSDALKADVERLKAEVDALRGELRLMREFLLQRLVQPSPAPPRSVKVAIGDNPTLGNREAPITLIEFSDYQCPFCRQFVETTLPGLKKEFIDTGQLRYVFRDFPIDQIHPLARKAAEAAHCAGDHGKYWTMHDLLFQHQDALQQDQLVAYAQQIRLDTTAFRGCLEEGKHQASVQQNLTDGMSAGIRGTPAFVLGKLRPDNTVESVLLTGARPLTDFRREIERLLAEK